MRMKDNMAMLRPTGKAQKIAEKILKNKGVKIASGKSTKSTKLTTPYLQH